MAEVVTPSSPRRWAGKVAAAWTGLLAIHAALVFTQAVLAGGFLSANSGMRAVHSAIGDDVLPWLALVMVVVGAILWRPGRGPWWPAAGGVLLMVGDVAQLATGFAGRLDVHVPLGVTIFGVSVLLLCGARGLRSLPSTADHPAESSPP